MRAVYQRMLCFYSGSLSWLRKGAQGEEAFRKKSKNRKRHFEKNAKRKIKIKMTLRGKSGSSRKRQETHDGV
jgi:hypothetical protein